MNGGPAVKTELLLKHKALSGYQRDFARAILSEEAYTVEEAKRALDKALKRKEGTKHGGRHL